MEVHKPKPIHNWRELAIEVGVIIVGIVIALSAEQLLLGLEVREKVTRAEEQMRFEMANDDGPEVIQRIALTECFSDAITGIRASIEGGSDRATVIAAIALLDIPRHTFDSDAYHAAESAGILSRLKPKRLDQWIYLYATMPVLDRVAEREYFDAASLHAIRSSGGPLSELEQMKVLEAVENLKRENRDIVVQAKQAYEAIKTIGIELAQPRMHQMLDEALERPAARPCVPKIKSMYDFRS